MYCTCKSRRKQNSFVKIIAPPPPKCNRSFLLIHLKCMLCSFRGITMQFLLGGCTCRITMFRQGIFFINVLGTYYTNCTQQKNYSWICHTLADTPSGNEPIKVRYWDDLWECSRQSATFQDMDM